MEISIKDGGFKPFVLEIKVDTREEAIALACQINVSLPLLDPEYWACYIRESKEQQLEAVKHCDGFMLSLFNKIMSQL